MSIISISPNDAMHQVFVTTRLGGHGLAPYDSMNLGLHVNDHPETVMANRQLVASWLAVASENVVYMDQIHGNDVVVVDNLPHHPPTCDAMVTTVPNLALMVLVADCVPIAFTAPGVVAVAHAGWRGTVANIVSNTVNQMCSVASLLPHQIHAFIGPSIGSCCYNVGDDVYNAAKKSIPNSDSCFDEREEGVFFDLQQANRLLLEKAGLEAANIVVMNECVACRSHRYFSYRAAHGITGRFGMGVMLVQ